MNNWNTLAPSVIQRLSKDLSITPQQAAGIVGQLGHESAGLQAINEYQPVVPGSRGGFGWAQWTGPRRKQFESWAKDQGLDVKDPEANYGFLVHELTNTPEKRALDYVRAAPDAIGAGRAFTDRFLRPGVPAYKSRDNWTNKALSAMGEQPQPAKQQAGFLERAASAVFPAAHASTLDAHRQQQDEAEAIAMMDFSDAPEQPKRKPKRWAEVEANPEFQALSTEEKHAAQEQYFNEVVAPQIPQAEHGAAKQEFFNQYNYRQPTTQVRERNTSEQLEQVTQGRSRLDEFGRQVGRQVGLTGRYALQGLSALPEMMINPFIEVAGGKPLKMSDALDTVGYVKPESASERISEDVVGLMASTGGLAGLTDKASKMTSGAVQGVMGLLSANPGQQLGGAIASGLSGGIARELDMPAPVQMAAPLIGGLLGSGLTNRAMNPKSKQPKLTTEDVKRKAKGYYDRAYERGVTASADQTQALKDNIRNIAKKEGLITPNNRLVKGYEKINGVMQMMDDYAGEPMTVKQMQSVRRLLSGAAGSMDASERRVGTMMIKAFDDFTAPLAPELAQARALYHSAMKSSTLDKMLEVADNRKVNYSQSGLENAIRSEYKNLSNKIVKGTERGWTPEEIKAINRVVKGTVPANIARYFGKLAPKGVVSGMASGGVPFMIGNSVGGPVAGGIASAGTMAFGGINHKLAEALTLRNARLVEQLVRGAHMQQPAMARPPLNPMPALMGASLLD